MALMILGLLVQLACVGICYGGVMGRYSDRLDLVMFFLVPLLFGLSVFLLSFGLYMELPK